VFWPIQNYLTSHLLCLSPFNSLRYFNMTTLFDKTRHLRVWGIIGALLFLSLLFSTPVLATVPFRDAAFAPKGVRGSLKVSPNGRYLIYSDGTPFFYLGDTAWELYHRLTREEADYYLKDRVSKGFTVIQAAVLAEFDGLRVPNPYGHVPLHDLDPTKPNEAYFKHVDYIVNKAEALGLYTAMLPTWGDKWHGRWGAGPKVFNPDNARVYGAWLGNRYKDKAIIWVLGGDRIPSNPEHYAIIRAMAEGIRSAVGPKQLMTYHPHYGGNSAKYFHNDTWLNFNFVQSGSKIAKNYQLIGDAYTRRPVKPVMDSEPLYEGCPTKDYTRVPSGVSDAYPLRQTAYWSLFAGGFGFTYGHCAIFAFTDPDGRYPVVVRHTAPWREALHDPGAAQMKYVRRLMESRDQLSIVPDQTLIAEGQGEGDDYMAACRGRDFAFAYASTGQNFTLKLGKLSASQVKARWYDPRTGKETYLGTYANRGTRAFDPPGNQARGNDWILILDEAAQNNPTPDTTYHFYKAINFAGNALSIDGQHWQASTTGGYTHNGKSFRNTTALLSPATDGAREQMIRSSVWHHRQLRLNLSGLPPAGYRVYLYTWEDNTPRTYSMALEGQTVVSNLSSGGAGTWKKHGPFKARISDGTILLTTTGHVNISGIELWKEAITTPPTCSATGTILREVWMDVEGRLVSDIPLSQSPAATSQLASLETGPNLGDNYGTRVRGYVCPPATGNYTFWIAGDDHAELWLSSSDKPAGKEKIAYSNWTPWREWTKYPSQQSAAIYLEAGKKYYIEVLHKEAAGRDGVTVGWQLPNGVLERPIPGSRLSPYASPAARTVSQPEGQLRAEETTRVFPNPADDQVSFTFSAPKMGAVDVVIHDALARQVKRIRVQAQPGSTTVVIAVKDLPPGLYFINGGSGITKKLVIDR
jgi:hypothetical protein